MRTKRAFSAILIAAAVSGFGLLAASPAQAATCYAVTAGYATPGYAKVYNASCTKPARAGMDYLVNASGTQYRVYGGWATVGNISTTATMPTSTTTVISRFGQVQP